MRFAILLALLVGCGNVSIRGDGSTQESADRSTVDAGSIDVLHKDAAAECPPTSLFCSGLPGACPQGQAQGSRRTCGGAPVAVCCPVNDCELALCDVCPLCAL